jgi:hypothetical protein
VPRRRCTSRSPTSPQSLQPTSTPALGPPRHHRSARATHALLPTSVLQLPQTAVPARARRPAGPTKPPDPATASPDLATGPPDLSAEGEAAATQKLQERAAMERRALQTPVGKPCCHCVHGRTDSRRPAQAAAKRAEEGSWGLAVPPQVQSDATERNNCLCINAYNLYHVMLPEDITLDNDANRIEGRGCVHI